MNLKKVLARPQHKVPRMSCWAMNVAGTLFNLVGVVHRRCHNIGSGSLSTPTARQMAKATMAVDQLSSHEFVAEGNPRNPKAGQWKAVLQNICNRAAGCLDAETPEPLASLYADVWAAASLTQEAVNDMLAYEKRTTVVTCRRWAKGILEGGASKAHLWTKIPVAWTPEVAGHVDHGPSSFVRSWASNSTRHC